jgi:hypothetical protein
MAGGRCPVAGCTKGRGDRQLMCKSHWYMVPKELRDRVWATAKKMWAGAEGGAEEWEEARDAAVAAVEQKEAG